MFHLQQCLRNNIESGLVEGMYIYMYKHENNTD